MLPSNNGKYQKRKLDDIVEKKGEVNLSYHFCSLSVYIIFF